MKMRRPHSSSNMSPHTTAPHVYLLFAATAIAFMTACRLFTGEVIASDAAEATPELPPYRATPAAQSPAAGICGYLDGDIVTITIYPDIPDPRCVEVRAEQKLRVINRRAELLHVAIGTFEADIPPDGEHIFDLPVGEYLLPGVHVILVSPCCSPEIVFEVDFP